MVQHKLDSSGRAAVTCKEGGGGAQSSVKLGQRQQRKKRCQARQTHPGLEEMRDSGEAGRRRRNGGGGVGKLRG